VSRRALISTTPAMLVRPPATATRLGTSPSQAKDTSRAVGATRYRAAVETVRLNHSLLPRDLPPGCEQHHLLEDPVLLAVSPALAARHWLEPGQPVRLAAFADENWLLPGPETSCHELTRRACGAAGFVPRSVAVASDLSVITALVGVGAGAAVVPRMALPAALAGVSLHPLTEPVTRSVSVLTTAGEGRQPHLSRVLDSLRAAARCTANPG
jgi:DNA-binding transcriptional LysR family regulator